MKKLLALSIFLTVFSSWANGPYTDPLLNWIYSQPVNTPEPEPVDVFEDYAAEASHDSWDNLYLCQYCDTEIIIDPYADMAEDGVYDVNYVR